MSLLTSSSWSRRILPARAGNDPEIEVLSPSFGSEQAKQINKRITKQYFLLSMFDDYNAKIENEMVFMFIKSLDLTFMRQPIFYLISNKIGCMNYRQRKISVFILLLLLITLANAQNLLILERPGTIKNFKYEVSDIIKIRTLSSDTLLKGVITFINDSIVVINNIQPVAISDIGKVYRTQWGFTFLQGLFLTAGAPYLLISTVNGIINNDEPIVPNETIIISGSLLAAGAAITPLTTRKFRIDNKKWRLRILDFTE
jgi:hypothetical protein